MATHAHDPGDSLSAAKQGGIGVAVITAVGGIIVAALNQIGVFDKGPSPSAGPAPTTISNPPQQTSPLGSMDKVEINAAGTEVTVTGSARKDVDSVAVMVGPRQSGGQYWANSTNVVNQHWTLVVTTDPHVPVPYEIKAYYRERAGSATTRGAPYVTPRQTGTPPPPPGKPVLLCAEQHGDSCFDGPGWGPPSIFRSDH